MTSPAGELISYVERNRLAPNTFLISPILWPSAPVTSYVARGSNRWRALIRSSSVVLESSVKKRMSSLNLKRACSTKQKGVSGSPSASENSYRLIDHRELLAEDEPVVLVRIHHYLVTVVVGLVGPLHRHVDVRRPAPA